MCVILEAMRRAIAFLTAAVLLLSTSAHAEGRKTARGAPRAACECITKKACWKLARDAYFQNTRISNTEIEAAVNDRFFPGAAAFALKKPDPEGHFLMVQCGGSQCFDKRDELERRMIVSSFLLSLPLGMKRSELINEQTWEISAKGEKVFTEAKTCKAGLFGELIDLLYSQMGQQ